MVRPGNSTPRRFLQSLRTLSSRAAPFGRSAEQTGTEFISIMNKDSSESEALSIFSDSVASVNGAMFSTDASGCSGMSSGIANGRIVVGTRDVVLEHTESGGVVIAS